jgi:hypothetical protein
MKNEKQKDVYCVQNFNGVDAYLFPKAMFSLEEVVIQMDKLSTTKYPKAPILFDENEIGYFLRFVLEI